MKKLLTFLATTFTLCLVLLPSSARAASPPTALFVGDTDVLGGGYWSTDALTGKLTEVQSTDVYNVCYDAETYTLYLDGATIKGDAGDFMDDAYYFHNVYGIYSNGGDLTISLSGENTVTAAGDDGTS